MKDKMITNKVKFYKDQNSKRAYGEIVFTESGAGIVILNKLGEKWQKRQAEQQNPSYGYQFYTRPEPRKIEVDTCGAKLPPMVNKPKEKPFAWKPEIKVF